MFKILHSVDIPRNSIAMTTTQREWCSLNVGDTVTICAYLVYRNAPYKVNYLLTHVYVEVDFLDNSHNSFDMYNVDLLREEFITQFRGLFLSMDQPLLFKWGCITSKMKIKALEVENPIWSRPNRYVGMYVNTGLLDTAKIHFTTAPGSTRKLIENGKIVPYTEHYTYDEMDPYVYDVLMF